MNILEEKRQIEQIEEAKANLFLDTGLPVYDEEFWTWFMDLENNKFRFLLMYGYAQMLNKTALENPISYLKNILGAGYNRKIYYTNLNDEKPLEYFCTFRGLSLQIKTHIFKKEGVMYYNHRFKTLGFLTLSDLQDFSMFNE